MWKVNKELGVDYFKKLLQLEAELDRVSWYADMPEWVELDGVVAMARINRVAINKQIAVIKQQLSEGFV